MGHIRLGKLPQTRSWKQVVELLETGANTPQIAAATLEAAKRGLKEASQDPGLIRALWLLTQLPLAARQRDFTQALRSLGLSIPDDPGLFDITAAFTQAVDNELWQTRGRTDLAEMAQLAAVETLAQKAGEYCPTLFAATSQDVQSAFRKFSTKDGFSRLARDFFSRLVYRYSAYFLSRELSNHVGTDKRFKDIAEHSAFNEAFSLHCWQSSFIVEEYAGGWYSAENYRGGIDEAKAANFVYVALKKLRKELAQRGPR